MVCKCLGLSFGIHFPEDSLEKIVLRSFFYGEVKFIPSLITSLNVVSA